MLHTCVRILYSMLHICVRTFDVTDTVEIFLETKQGLSLPQLNIIAKRTYIRWGLWHIYVQETSASFADFPKDHRLTAGKLARAVGCPDGYDSVHALSLSCPVLSSVPWLYCLRPCSAC